VERAAAAVKGIEQYRACLGEMYRYRLALRDQRQRLDEGVQRLRQRREEIDAQAMDLLVAPSMPMDQVRERLEAIHLQDVPEQWRLKTEAQFVLVAVRGIFVMARAIEGTAPASVRSVVGAALGRFQAAVPDAMVLRHVHEHFEEYLAGRGHHQSKLPAPVAESLLAMLDQGIAYFIGGKLFLLWEIADAAEELAREIAEATRDGTADPDESQGQSPA
jgi:hypothetical protein